MCHAPVQLRFLRPHCCHVVQANPTIKGSAAATMGYKGIETDYLPASTVPLKTVVLPGCKEFCYH